MNPPPKQEFHASEKSSEKNRIDSVNNLVTVATQMKSFNQGTMGKAQRDLRDAIVEWDSHKLDLTPFELNARMDDAIVNGKDIFVSEYNQAATNDPSIQEIDDEQISDATFLDALRKFLSTGDFSIPGTRNDVTNRLAPNVVDELSEVIEAR